MQFSRKKFFDAIRKNDLDLINIYISNGIDINITEKTSGGFTPIHASAYRNNLDLCKLFLSKGADITKDESILNWPCYHSNYEIFKLLVKNNVFYNKLILGENLIQACTKNNFDIARDLILLGADPNYVDKDSYTPLHQASRYGEIDLVKLLVENKAKINVRLRNNYSPFMYAMSKDKFDIVEYLYANGADIEGVEIINSSGFCTGMVTGSSEMAKFYRILICNDPQKLKEFKIELKKRLDFLKGGELEKELKEAILQQNFLLAKKLIENNPDKINIDINYELDYLRNVTPLHLAIMVNNYYIVKLLLEKGANINATTSQNDTVYTLLRYENKNRDTRKIYKLLKKTKANMLMPIENKRKSKSKSKYSKYINTEVIREKDELTIKVNVKPGLKEFIEKSKKKRF